MKKKILVVDDEIEIARIICSLLDAEGYQCEAVASAWKGLDVLVEFAPDLIIVDYMMPMVSGADFIRTIRGIQRFSRTPIILMAPISPREVREQVGWTEFLAKPISFSILQESVSRHLKGTNAIAK